MDREEMEIIDESDIPTSRNNGIQIRIANGGFADIMANLSQAYFQIPLAKDSRKITAFSVPGMGLYHLTRMPYGLIGAPAIF